MKNGFTLIELLAVIVILAIIALIAVPIVLNIINDSKESSLLRSAEFYLDAAEYTIADAFLYHGGLSNGSYPITKDGDICKVALVNNECSQENTLKVEVNGKKTTGGTITINNGNISNVELILDEKTIVKNTAGELVYYNPVCTIERQNEGKYTVGDLVTCGEEQFYVIENEDEDTTLGIDMLAKYNITLEEDPKQDKEGTTTSIEFSSNNYWYDNTNSVYTVDANYISEGRNKPYIYNSSSLIYSYVEAYKSVLIENSINVLDAKLLSYEQAVKFGCSSSTQTCPSAPSWFKIESLSVDTFWLGSAYNEQYVSVASKTYFGTVIRSYVRPLITITKYDLK